MNKVYSWRSLIRRKTEDIGGSQSELARVLTLFDLTSLGVGSTLGLGVYVLAGSVAYNIAGPAVTLSFLIAAIASGFAAICYGEFAARVPKAGSAYVYSYVTIGEFVAFTIGWNMVLEYVIGAASVARGFSGYFDALIDKNMSKTLMEAMPIHVNFLGDYPDFLAFGMILILTALLAFGVKKSSFFNNVFTSVNMLTIITVVVAGSFYANIYNWSIPQHEVPPGFGVGGFMPFGMAGVMAGAAKCFFGFVGFDGIATTGEEAINPNRNIPLAIMISLIIVFFAYFSISTVLTLMIPYYLQDHQAPFPIAFETVGLISVKWVVTGGAIFALCTSMLCAMFPLPRVLYSMASDGIIFKAMSKVNNYTKTPFLATIISGVFAGVMALIFDLNQLIDMMSIGTLMAYSIVAICVLILRYEDEVMVQATTLTTSTVLKQFFNLNRFREPNKLSSVMSKVGVILFAFFCILWCIFEKIFPYGSVSNTVVLSVLSIIMIILMISIGMQPVTSKKLYFMVPLVPLIPCLSIMSNVYLMFQLDFHTWVRFLIWLAVGYIIYFSYGIRNSTQITRSRMSADEAKKKEEYTNKAFETDWKQDYTKDEKL